jgi:hypothetical protein
VMIPPPEDADEVGVLIPPPELTGADGVAKALVEDEPADPNPLASRNSFHSSNIMNLVFDGIGVDSVLGDVVSELVGVRFFTVLEEDELLGL